MAFDTPPSLSGQNRGPASRDEGPSADARAVHRRFSTKPGAEHIASEFALAHMAALLREGLIRTVLGWPRPILKRGKGCKIGQVRAA